MKVGNREFSKREDAGNALNAVIMSWRDDKTMKVRGHYKGFEILSRAASGKGAIPIFSSGARTPTRRT